MIERLQATVDHVLTCQTQALKIGRSRAPNHQYYRVGAPGLSAPPGVFLPVKRHRGEPGHTRDTRDTRAHAGTRITRTNLTTIHPNPKTQTRTAARKPRPTQQPQEQPQARSRPLPAADYR